MTKLLKGVAISVLPMLLLVGCASHSKSNFTVGSVQNTYKTKHPIVIDEREQILDIPVPSSSYDLPRAVASSIEGFGAEYKRAANGVITIMIPSGSSNESAARAVAPKVSEALAIAGVSYAKMRTTTYYAGEHGVSAPIRLSYGAVSASVSGCGKWPEDLAGANSENKNYHNFGCGYQNNIASMIANPADLLAPRGTTPIDAKRRDNIITDYREGTPATPVDSQAAF